MAPRKRTGAAAANGKVLEKTEEKMDSKDVEDSKPMEVQPKKSVRAKVAPKEKAAKKIEEESADENVCDDDDVKPAKPAAVKRGKKTTVQKEVFLNISFFFNVLSMLYIFFLKKRIKMRRVKMKRMMMCKRPSLSQNQRRLKLQLNVEKLGRNLLKRFVFLIYFSNLVLCVTHFY
jgi:hypothetical protein